MSNHQEKLIPAKSSTNIGAPCAFPEQVCECSQDGIPSLVPKSVVDGLEGIDVTQDDPEMKAVPGRTLHLFACPRFQRPPIRQTSQRIGLRCFFQFLALGRNLAIQINDPPANADTCQHFAIIKRLCKIVVGTSLQP